MEPIIIAELVAQVRDIEAEIAHHELDRGADLLGRARSALAALRGADRGRPLRSRCGRRLQPGFDRALLSTVDEGTWRLQSMHVDRDMRWAEEILAVGR